MLKNTFYVCQKFNFMRTLKQIYMAHKLKIILGSSLIVILTLFFSLTLTINHSYAVPSSDTTRFINEKREYIKHFVKQKNIDGMAIAFFTNDKIIWKECFGNSTYSKPINDSTLFGICSMSKSFTALAVLTAVQDGLVDLDTPIKKYLSDFKVNSCFEESPEDKITLRMMLSHTAGFTHEAPVGNNFDWKCPSKQAHWNSLRETWLKFPVNTSWSYSAYGFDIAAEIIEKVSGIPFEKYVKEKVLNPLNMKYSTLDDSIILSNNNSTEGFFNPFIKKGHIKISIIGAAAVYSNINEMIKYVQFHMNQGNVKGKQIIEKKYLYEMYKINRNFYGLGIWITRPDFTDKLKTFYLSHGGEGFGYSSYMLWFPEYNLGCVILGNKMFNQHDYYKIAEQLTTDFILNNENTLNNKNQNVGFVPVFKTDEKNNQKPTFIYPTDKEYNKESVKYNIVGKYEQMIDLDYAKWFSKIILSLHIFKPIKLSVIMNQNTIIMDGAFGKSQLKEYIPGLYFTEDGEAFDIRNNIPTFRNIKLRKYSDKP